MTLPLFKTHLHAPATLGDHVHRMTSSVDDHGSEGEMAYAMARNLAETLALVVDSLPVETQRVIANLLLLTEAEPEGVTPA